MRKTKKILYLDQFAVSNMYDAAPASIWEQLRTTIQEKVSKGVLSCPMPLEGLYETLGRSNRDSIGNPNRDYTKKITEQFNFYRELAHGNAFYGYEEIAATEIIMLLRQGKIKPIKSIYIHKSPYAQIDLSDLYEIGHAFNEENHNYYRKLFQGVNEFREVVKPINNDNSAKQKKIVDSLFIKALVPIMVKKYIEGLKDFYQNKYVKVRRVNCGTFEGFNKVDVLLYNLTKKRINKKETEKLIEEFETNGFNRIPSMNIRSLLSADISICNKQQVPNDEIDMDRAAIGLRISDYFFADNDKKLSIEKYKLNEKYHTKIYSGKKDSITSLIKELSSI